MPSPTAARRLTHDLLHFVTAGDKFVQWDRIEARAADLEAPDHLDRMEGCGIRCCRGGGGRGCHPFLNSRRQFAGRQKDPQ